MKESGTASHIRLAAAKIGVDLWRNNSGAFEDETGRWIRYGLCNDSALVSKEIKSSDFIGITPVVVTQEMVGQTLGVFTAIETKPTGWVLKPHDQRGLAQEKFHEIVRKAGGLPGLPAPLNNLKGLLNMYRKKPVVIDAFQLDFGDDTHPLQKYPKWFNQAVIDGTASYQGGAVPCYIIATLEGDMKAIQGDWIIQGVKGELYPCKPEIFALTYEAVE